MADVRAIAPVGKVESAIARLTAECANGSVKGVLMTLVRTDGGLTQEAYGTVTIGDLAITADMLTTSVVRMLTGAEA